MAGPHESTPRQAYKSGPLSSRRNKLAPDPDVRWAILAAASKTVDDQGVGGLSIAAVLERAQLSTRAFYRHFESKEQLVAEVFSVLARVEMLRLRRRMANVASPVEAVATWIDGRLDLAFDENTEFDLRRLPREVQSEVLSSTEVVSPAHTAILEPLVEQLHRGLEIGVFQGIVPEAAAKSIHGVVWAATQEQWSTDHRGCNQVCESALQFCLRALGVAPKTIQQIIGGDALAG
jgi:AcrR family transcriptional regulator